MSVLGISGKFCSYHAFRTQPKIEVMLIRMLQGYCNSVVTWQKGRCLFKWLLGKGAELVCDSLQPAHQASPSGTETNLLRMTWPDEGSIYTQILVLDQNCLHATGLAQIQSVRSSTS